MKGRYINIRNEWNFVNLLPWHRHFIGRNLMRVGEIGEKEHSGTSMAFWTRLVMRGAMQQPTCIDTTTTSPDVTPPAVLTSMSLHAHSRITMTSIVDNNNNNNIHLSIQIVMHAVRLYDIIATSLTEVRFSLDTMPKPV